MTAPSGVHHVALKAADPERVAAFYRDVLGLGELARHPMPDAPERLRSVWLACGAAILMVERAGVEAPALDAFADDPPGLHLLALRIERAQAAAFRERLAAAGVPVAHATEWTLYVRDPEGNRVGLSWYEG